MNENELTFSPSEFSKMCGVSKQTLLLYDKIGLLKPFHVDQRGFRRYHNQQYDLVTTIQTLKEIGMPLAEIAIIINQRTPQSLIHLFSEKLPILQKQIEVLQNIYQSMEHLEAEWIKCSECLEGKTPLLVDLAIADHMKFRRQHTLQINHSPCSMVKVIGCMDRKQNTYSYLYTRMAANCEEPGLVLKPVGQYLVAYYRGDYTTSYQRHPSIVQYSVLHNLTIGSYFYEESMIDEVACADPKDYITRIEVPVIK